MSDGAAPALTAESGEPAVGAREAWRFITSLARADGEGWRRHDGEPDDAPAGQSVYHGNAGVLLFALEIAAASGDQAVLATATAIGRRMDAALRETAWLPVNLMAGWAGLLFVLDCLHGATADIGFREGARRCAERIRDQATPIGAGIGWIEPIPYSDITGASGEREMTDLTVGGAGAIPALVHAHRRGLLSEALDLARQAGDRLIEIAEPTANGLRWAMMQPMAFPFAAPNFSHGSAGVAFALARLAQATGEARYLDAVVAGMDFTLSHACGCGDGALINYIEDLDPPAFYLGVCHGPPGTGRTLVLLDELTGDPRWRQALERLVAGLEASGAPEVRSAGLWHNFGQCCGDAGIGDFALLLARRGIWPEGHAVAERCAANILAHGERADDKRWWPHAEHRARPELIESQTGYMQGAAGIGSFLLHLHLHGTGQNAALWPLDWPHEAGTDPAMPAPC